MHHLSYHGLCHLCLYLCVCVFCQAIVSLMFSYRQKYSEWVNSIVFEELPSNWDLVCLNVSVGWKMSQCSGAVNPAGINNTAIQCQDGGWVGWRLGRGVEKRGGGSSALRAWSEKWSDQSCISHSLTLFLAFPLHLYFSPSSPPFPHSLPHRSLPLYVNIGFFENLNDWL